MLDLLMLWRGQPGWFYRSEGGRGSGGSADVGAGSKGRVSQYSTFGDVTIGFDADFDAAVVALEHTSVRLGQINTVVVDAVDGSAARRISATRWTEPRLPLVGDVNLELARRSSALLNDLQCDIPMPKPPPMFRTPIITVCEKVK